jgi:hypothetical protein
MGIPHQKPTKDRGSEQTDTEAIETTEKTTKGKIIKANDIVAIAHAATRYISAGQFGTKPNLAASWAPMRTETLWKTKISAANY